MGWNSFTPLGVRLENWISNMKEKSSGCFCKEETNWMLLVDN
jgi:hypothetical protein